MNTGDLKFKTRAKIHHARKLADKLPPDQAKIIHDLCTAHAAMAETCSRLHKDNRELRENMEAARKEHRP